MADSIPTMIAAARIVREQVGVMSKSVDVVTLQKNTGTVWNEIQLEKLTAQAITESTKLDNPQQLEDTLFSVTPTSVGIQTLVTDRVAQRISQKSLAKTGQLAQNAIERKKDIDGLTAIDGFTIQLNVAGASLTSGHIRAARARITSNTTEPAPQDGQIFGVFHGFQIKDIEDEILNPTAGALGAALQSGPAAQVFKNGTVGMVGGVIIREDGNMTIDAADDAKGGVFHKMSLVLVQGRAPRMETRREPHIGAGATSIFHYDEYAYGERSGGNWAYEIISDASLPTS